MSLFKRTRQNIFFAPDFPLFGAFFFQNNIFHLLLIPLRHKRDLTKKKRVDFSYRFNNSYFPEVLKKTAEFHLIANESNLLRFSTT